MTEWRNLAALGCSLTALLSCAGQANPDNPTSLAAVPFTTLGDTLGIWDGAQYRSLFVKGVNLGVAVPGTQAGELAATREQYDRWLSEIAEIGFNAVRIYTLHYPRFYDAVAQYNQAHPGAPIYVLHGMWLDEENPSGDFFDMTDGFDANIDEAIDCAHGRCTIGERRGRAFGSYRSDISPWIAGWIIGREIAPHEVATTNAAHPTETSTNGAALRLPSGTPLETWIVNRLDRLVLRERASYGVERPVSVSNWPTLDPLRHPSERTGAEDIASLDLENIDTAGAPGGFFASYHAYPYYPNFMTRESALQNVRDREGLNSYAGYLLDLKRHYATHPLLIAELGVPTSWGNAHFGAAGMNHGGQTEIEQGQDAARLLTNVLDAHCAGGALFAWIDEWWKRTWIVDELSLPRERYRLWHNITSPEQNFGLIAFEPVPPRFDRFPAATGSGRILEVRADVDVAYFHLRLALSAPLSDGEIMTVGFDTYDDGVGESILPGGITSTKRSEFALVLKAPNDAQLYVTPAYDLFGIWHGTSSDAQLYHSVASDRGEWVPVRWKNDAAAIAEDGTVIPEAIDEIGRLLVRLPGGTQTSREAIAIDGGRIDVRIPWTLLQFADPSTRSVIDDDRTTPDRETATSEGIAVSIHVGPDHVDTGRFRWDGWEEVPATSERKKDSTEVLKSTLRALP